MKFCRKRRASQGERQDEGSRDRPIWAFFPFFLGNRVFRIEDRWGMWQRRTEAEQQRTGKAWLAATVGRGGQDWRERSCFRFSHPLECGSNSRAAYGGFVPTERFGTAGNDAAGRRTYGGRTMRRDAAPTEGERCGGTPHLRRIPRCQRARGPGDWSSRSACVTVHRYLYQIGGRISIEVIEPLGGILGAAVVPTERFLLLPALLFCPLPERFVRFLC